MGFLHGSLNFVFYFYVILYVIIVALSSSIPAVALLIGPIWGIVMSVITLLSLPWLNHLERQYKKII